MISREQVRIRVGVSRRAVQRKYRGVVGRVVEHASWLFVTTRDKHQTRKTERILSKRKILLDFLKICKKCG